MLRDRRQVFKSGGDNPGTQVTCTALAACMSSMEMRLILDFQGVGFERLQALLSHQQVWIGHVSGLLLIVFDVLTQPDGLADDKQDKQTH